MMRFDKAMELAESIRPTNPALADKIINLIQQAETANRDSVNITVSTKYRVKKYDGEYEPGKVPVEVIEGTA